MLSQLKGQNEKLDREIHNLCQRYSDGTVALKYHTEFTETCKPKHAKIYRALCITPATAPTMQMQVTCPDTSKGGDSIQIQAPCGVMAVVVPAGVGPGGIFMVTVPAVPMADAVPVQVMAQEIPPA